MGRSPFEENGGDDAENPYVWATVMKPIAEIPKTPTTALERWFGTSIGVRVALAGVIALASALRFYGLRIQSLRNDEQYSRWTSSLDTLAEVIDQGALRDVHPPGYAVILHYLIQWFGDSEVALRLPASIAGVVAVYWMFRLGTLLHSETSGLYAAALLAVLPLPIYHAQDCRAYSFLLAGAVVQAYLALLLDRVIATKSKTVWLWVAYAVNGLFVAYLHYFGLLWVACVGMMSLVTVLRKPQRLRVWLLVHGLLAVAYVPWLFSVMVQVRRGDSWMPKPTFKELGRLAYNVLGRHPVEWVGLVLLGAAVAAYAAHRRGSLGGVFTANTRRNLWVLGLWIVVPLTLALALSWTVLPVISARNFIIVLPAATLLLAWSLRTIDVKWWRGYPLSGVLVVGVLLFELLFVRRYYTTQTKRQFRQSAAYVWNVAQRMQTRPFIATEEVWEEYLGYYWRALRDQQGTGDESKIPIISAVASKLTERLAKDQPEEVILILSLTKDRTTLPRRLPGYREISTKHFVGIDVKRLRRNR